MPLRWRIRRLLAELLPRWLAVWLRIRILTPGDRRPSASIRVAPAETGGAWRAKLRGQDPAIDPKEPSSGESSSTGTDHGWSNCTMASAATAMAYQAPHGELVPWGGDLRHRQGDQTGGTDLYDAREAWSTYGETLTIRSGSGWSGVKQAHGEGRAIVCQGEGNVPGAETFDGGHACAIGPETRASDGAWLFGDPLASDWQWVAPGKIRDWMEQLSGGCLFATGQLPPAEPTPPKPPVPAPVPPPPPPDPDYGDGYQRGREAGTAAESDRVFASWLETGFRIGRGELAGGRWGLAQWSGDPWAHWPIPLDQLNRARQPATWHAAGWTAALWRD